MFRRLVHSLWRSTRRCSNAQHEQALSPAVRALVDRNHLDTSKIVPTGPKGRLLKGDVLDYLQQGSRDSRDIVKWRAPPTVGEMWSQPSEYLVPHGFALTNAEASQAVSGEHLEGMVVKATALTSKEMSQDSVNISVVMATGGSLTASVINSELVTMETPLDDISTLITQHQQPWNNVTQQSTSPLICVSTNTGHLSFINLTTLLIPASSMLVLARRHDNNDHMISIAVSHDLRVIDQSQTEQWLQTFQRVISKL